MRLGLVLEVLWQVCCLTLVLATAVVLYANGDLGSAAAGIQAGIGNVAFGTLFALLQSAGAGGAGAGILGGTVFSATSLASWGATIPGLIAASKENRKTEKIKEKEVEEEVDTGDQDEEKQIIELVDDDQQDLDAKS